METGRIIPAVMGDVVLGGSQAISGVGALAYKSLPWKEVAAWTHRLPTGFTDHWMDKIDGAVRGSNHRWQHHNPFDFISAKLRGDAGGELSTSAYLKHAAADFITVKGLPLLPESVHNALVAAGVPKHVLYAWTHVNVVDVALGCYSLGTGAYSLFLAIGGHMPWGWETLIVTCGGVLEVGLGFCMKNPLLVVGGGLKVAAGAVSLAQHLTAPAPTLWETMLPGMLGGLTIGGMAAAVRLALNWNATDTAGKACMAAETIGLSTILGALAAINPCIAIPLGVAYTAGKFAWTLGQRKHLRQCVPIYAGVYGSQYGQRYGRSYGNSYGNPYGNRYGSPYGRPYGES